MFSIITTLVISHQILLPCVSPYFAYNKNQRSYEVTKSNHSQNFDLLVLSRGFFLQNTKNQVFFISINTEYIHLFLRLVLYSLNIGFIKPFCTIKPQTSKEFIKGRILISDNTGCPKKHGNSVTNLISSLSSIQHCNT